MAQVPVTDHQHWFLSANGKWEMPHLLMPPFMSNKRSYTGTLGNLCRWLAEQAEGLGVEIFPGFAAAAILYNEVGSVKAVAPGDMAIASYGGHNPPSPPGL